MVFVVSVQSDPYFEVYSSVDERSAAYLACGLAAESGEPVVISCTGATASRNYMPGLTEAYYRKLPVLAVTSTQPTSRIGHHVAQVIDRSSLPKDTCNLSVLLPAVKDDEDVWDCEMKVNSAILELTRRGGGPAHINLTTIYSKDYSVNELPQYRCVRRFGYADDFPSLPSGKIAVFIGAHHDWSESETISLEKFCEANGAIVISDHTSGYKGKFNLHYALVGCQEMFDPSLNRPDLLIHIGEVTGDYYGLKIGGAEVWRVSPDGEIRDTFKKLTAVFETEEKSFFDRYSDGQKTEFNYYYELCFQQLKKVREDLPNIPFSNLWVASQLAPEMPEGSVIHFGILNSLRAWNFFDLHESVRTASNVGGFGIDGGLSSLIGASFANSEKLYFCVIGDLAFFYDMNVLGNRHVGKNIRVLLINNGKGTEFRQYGEVSKKFGDDLDQFVAAGGHFGNKSKSLVKHFAQDLGFHYIAASNKEEFKQEYEVFINPSEFSSPMVFEVFTDSDTETEALEMIMKIQKDVQKRAKNLAKEAARNVLGERSTKIFKKLTRS